LSHLTGKRPIGPRAEAISCCGWIARHQHDASRFRCRAHRRATGQKLGQVRDAIAWPRRSKAPVTHPAVARRAAVSRTFLYENAEARALVEAACAANAARRQHDQAGQDEAEASWQERALNAEDALKTVHAEIRAQRDRIGQLPGQLRDTERELTDEAAHRAATENTTLRQRVRQLTADNRALTERLEAARSNNRFADRRIAQLEAQLTENVPAR
jgi:chromosome segregation ATPase